MLNRRDVPLQVFNGIGVLHHLPLLQQRVPLEAGEAKDLGRSRSSNAIHALRFEHKCFQQMPRQLHRPIGSQLSSLFAGNVQCNRHGSPPECTESVSLRIANKGSVVKPQR